MQYLLYIQKYFYTFSLAVVGLLITSCADEKHEVITKVPEGKTTINIGVGAEVATLDPALIADAVSMRVASDLFEGLTVLDQNNKVSPGVASYWDISKDGLTYTFHLRENAKWSNGEPVTADDFVYSFQRIVDPKTASPFGAIFLDAIVNAEAIITGKLPKDHLGIKAINDKTLMITLKHPQIYFLDILAIITFVPVHKKTVERYEESWATSGKIVSNGAYNLDEWVENGYISATKNSQYWGQESVKISKVKYLPIGDATAEFNQYRSGEIDITFTVPAGVGKKEYQKTFGRSFYNVPLLASYYYWYNMKNSAFSDMRVRKALTMVLDREEITTDILRMGETPSYNILPNNIEDGAYKNFYTTLSEYDWVNWPLEKRQKVAKKLLIQAGYNAENPLRFNILYPTSGGGGTGISLILNEAIIGQWQEAFGGLIDVKLDNEEFKVYIQTMQSKEFDFSYAGWTADFNEASDFLQNLVCNSSNNDANICDKNLDRAYHLGVKAPDIKTYRYYMKEALRISMLNYYILPVYSYTYSFLMQGYIGGYDPKHNSLNVVYTKWMHFKH